MPDNIEQKFNCNYCDWNIDSSESLKAHLIDTHWEQIFLCQHCKSYLPREQLMPHMQQHADDIESKTRQKPETTKSSHSFVCSQCNAAFRTKRVLNNHIRCKHQCNDKREFVCNVCEKAFKTDANLYTHSKIHDSTKPHKCQYCNKSFRLKHHLAEHEVQHKIVRQEERIKCERCCKTFATVAHLRKHAKIHILNDCTCRICGEKLKQLRYLQRHMLKVHLHLNV